MVNTVVNDNSRIFLSAIMFQPHDIINLIRNWNTTDTFTLKVPLTH